MQDRNKAGAAYTPGLASPSLGTSLKVAELSWEETPGPQERPSPAFSKSVPTSTHPNAKKAPGCGLPLPIQSQQ